MDKVLVFGTSDVGSIPAGGIKTKNQNDFSLYASRNDDSSVDESVRQGRGNPRVATRGLSLTIRGIINLVKQSNLNLNIPKQVVEVSLALSHAKFENFLVGGCVRDLLLDKKPRDWDITTIATPEEIIKIFPKTFYENDYGTVGVVLEGETDESLKVIEVTPYRIESGYSDTRHPDKVTWGKSIQEDLARRDFSVNAIAYSVDKEEIIDPYEGREDIKKQVIRTVGKPDERFSEDALRMLRAVRFSAELGFAIDSETLASIEKNSPLLEKISKERIRDEFIKIIQSPGPAFALETAMRTGLLKYIAPDFMEGVGMEQNQAHAYTVWEHLLRSLEHAAKKKFPLNVRLAALFHDIGKPHTRKWLKNQWTFYGHDVVGAKITKKTLTDLKLPKEIVDDVSKLVRWHMFFSDTDTITLSAVRRMVRNVSPELIWELMNTRAADRIGTGRPKESPYRLRKYHSMVEEVMRDPISVKQLKINGGQIIKVTGSTAGPHIGYILEVLLNEVLEDPKKNTEEYLENRTKELYKLNPDELEQLGIDARRHNQSEDEMESEKIKGKYGVK